MRKIIFLLCAVLGVSGVAFGQKKPELLWEKETVSFGFFGFGISVTSTEKIILSDVTSDGKAIYEKDGQIMQFPMKGKYSGFYVGKNINWFYSPSRDSVYIADKELNLIKEIAGSYNLSEVSDGILDFSDTKVIKYDFKGNLLWKYTSSKKIKESQKVLFLKEKLSSSLLELEEGGFLFFDKNGNSSHIPDLQGIVAADDKQVFNTSDGGFWYASLNNFVKYDSGGKQTAYVDFEKENIKYLQAWTINKGTIINNDNALIVFQYKGQDMFFTKIEIDGKIKTISKQVNGFRGTTSPKFQMINNDEFMFSHIDFDSKRNIGVVNFQKPESSWVKEVNSFFDDVFCEDSFLTFVRTKDNKTTNINIFDLKGNLAWAIANDSITNVIQAKSKKYIYVDYNSSVAKYQISNGEKLWQFSKPKGVTVYGISFEGADGNDYWYNSTGNGTDAKIDLIKNKKKTDFFKFPNTFDQIHSPWIIDYKNKAIITATSESFQQILRKYSTRCAYGLEATAEADGKTEVCTGTKVKLSTTKQDGLTYQWQKDGKDIPTFKDVVHDVEESGNYTVTVKDEICQSQTTSNPIKVTIKPTPEASISTDIKGVVYEPFTVKMSANTGTGLSYQWLKDDVIIPSETTANYEAKKSGKYNVSVSKDGCTKLSDALTISILIPLANQKEVGEEVVQIYPNPNKGEFKIILPKALKSADIQLFDSYGRERTLTYKGEQAQAEGLVIGAYFLRVSKDGKVVTSKLIIE
jgi:hypothetical protein